MNDAVYRHRIHIIIVLHLLGGLMFKFPITSEEGPHA